TDVRLVDTGSIGDVRRINQLGLEAAWQHGPFSAQGEYLQARVQRSSAQPDLAFDGWYVSASWLLTGESRGYRSGVFRGINPQGSRGAWELVGRFSTVKLDDGPVAGGKQDNWSIGVNWYANARIRLMANHIQVKSRRAGVSDDSGILLARVQVAF
ncbi:MAG: OprO/OprP family phosphate-selective porin, partial [Wenzhouxiangella sp.]|nr:OprO/OprP family phosphate-selective porin [Wenzhouxiangella sp.]